MKADLVCNALKMALERRKPVESVIMHTVRGSQYCPKKYQKMIRLHGLQCDMSGKSNCYDNAVYEGFCHTLKVKLIYQRKYEFRAQGKRSDLVCRGFLQSSSKTFWRRLSKSDRLRDSSRECCLKNTSFYWRQIMRA